MEHPSEALEQLAIYRELLASSQRELDLYRSYYERAKIAESLLTADQKTEYYRLLSERGM